jgi:hypothetical protein
LLAGLKLIDLEDVKLLEMAEVFSLGFTGIIVRLPDGLLVDELLQFARFVQIHF